MGTCTGNRIRSDIKIRFRGTLDEVLSQTLDSGALPIAFADLDKHDWRSSLFFNPPEEWDSCTYPQIFEIDLGDFVLAEGKWSYYKNRSLQTANLKGQETQTKVDDDKNFGYRPHGKTDPTSIKMYQNFTAVYINPALSKVIEEAGKNGYFPSDISKPNYMSLDKAVANPRPSPLALPYGLVTDGPVEGGSEWKREEYVPLISRISRFLRKPTEPEDLFLVNEYIPARITSENIDGKVQFVLYVPTPTTITIEPEIVRNLQIKRVGNVILVS